ncbi:hypothetical protein AYY16_16050 [Morganella psychrotolerans]|nr:hypothetical protein AYY16_16050 [Morganella psychrotolerans]
MGLNSQEQKLTGLAADNMAINVHNDASASAKASVYHHNGTVTGIKVKYGVFPADFYSVKMVY